jgi:hypothetical protein
VKSRDGRLIVTGAKNLAHKGTASIIAVGINKYANNTYDLRYATRDAQGFSEELKQKQGELDTFSRVEVGPLLDENATKNNIVAALHLLAGAGCNSTGSAGSIAAP